jgi:hypothetical protein
MHDALLGLGFGLRLDSLRGVRKCVFFVKLVPSFFFSTLISMRDKKVEPLLMNFPLKYINYSLDNKKEFFLPFGSHA